MIPRLSHVHWLAVLLAVLLALLSPCFRPGGRFYDGDSSWTLRAHGSGEGGLPIDAVGLLAPAEWWESTPPSSATRRTALATESTALAAWGARVADGLVACMANNYGFQRKAGVGLLGQEEDES